MSDGLQRNCRKPLPGRGLSSRTRSGRAGHSQISFSSARSSHSLSNVSSLGAPRPSRNWKPCIFHLPPNTSSARLLALFVVARLHQARQILNSTLGRRSYDG